MKTENLVSNGYLPIEELPPPFTTEELGLASIALYNHFKSLDNSIKKKYRETQCIQYSTPKVGLSRRIFGIPNPIHQIELSKIISDNWNEIRRIYNNSKISASVPKKDFKGTRAIKKFDFKKFKEKRIEVSFNKVFELKTDIAKYFPSIYTHAIPWAMHTKKLAKKKRNDSSLIGNLIDKALRSGQSGQTNGIPIGPDTSRIIAEILGCTFDQKLTEKFSNIVGYRFIDDCYFYFSSYSEAERVFKCFEAILTDYGLDINEEKTSIRKLPFPYESNWVIELSNFNIRNSIKGQRTDLMNFISLSFNLTIDNPKDSVLKFAIKKLSYQKILRPNWKLFQALLFKIGISEPVTLPILLKILLNHPDWINKDMIDQFIHEILEEHIYKGHNFEVAWALWIAKCFSIDIKDSTAQKIFKSRDVISIIIALDLKEIGLITELVDLSQIEAELTEDGLINEWWLLTYESVKKGWLKPSDPKLLKNSEYFSELEKRDIEFYNPSKESKIEGEFVNYDFSV